MAEFIYVLIKQESYLAAPPPFAVAVTPHDRPANPPDDTEKYIYDVFQFQPNAGSKTFNIKARFTKGVSTGAILRVFDTHDAASEHLQEIQLELLGGDWGDTEKATIHLKLEPYSGDYWYLQVVEAAVPGHEIHPSAWGSGIVSCEIFEPEVMI